MFWLLIIAIAVLLIAYANGANDNFKGVATLFGSGTTEYRKALSWATVTTLAIYFLMHQSRNMLGVTRKTCLCVGRKAIPAGDCFVGPSGLLAMTSLRGTARRSRGGTEAISKPSVPEVFVGDEASCEAKAIEAYEGKIFGISAQSALDFLHFLSAGAVSFARGLNDTPKIVALLVAAGVLGLRWNIGLVALAMAIGGILGARKVAETVSHKITTMNHGQGFSANLVTAILVIFASHSGMPVSTTHVSCGALFGIGLVNGRARWDVIASILGAWVLTLPVSAILSAASFFVLSKIGV